MNPQDTLPVFPLNTVLFPGCRLPLQIFEQRYLEMVKTCLKKEQGFVVVRIIKGQEAGLVPEICSVGTQAFIVDWNQLENGLLGITVEGRERVKILNTQKQADGLLLGQIEKFSETPHFEHEQIEAMSELLETLRRHPAVQQLGLQIDTTELNSLFWCLSGLMPFNDPEKQYLLELNEPEKRLTAFTTLLKQLEGDQA